MGEYVMVDVGGRRLYAHRILVQRWLGRKLIPNEVVHHVDNDGTNNRPSNLQVTTRRKHSKAHARGDPPILIPGTPTLDTAAVSYGTFLATLQQSRSSLP